MNEVNKLIELVQKKARLVAMLAPSFPIVYQYPQIISKLKQLGFGYVIEVAVGARKTNSQVLALLEVNPKGRFITSPCPSFVRFIRKKHRDLLPYLALKADSPMIACAKIVQEKYPGFQPVFIGPCNVKKLEADEDYPELNILVLTYQELDEVFKKFDIKDPPSQTNDVFDITEKATRIYPLDAGLTESSGLRNILKDEEIRIVSGWENCENILQEFRDNQKIRLVDILFCEAGCINGPNIVSNLSLEERKKKIIDFSQL